MCSHPWPGDQLPQCHRAGKSDVSNSFARKSLMSQLPLWAQRSENGEEEDEEIESSQTRRADCPQDPSAARGFCRMVNDRLPVLAARSVKPSSDISNVARRLSA